MHLSWLSPQTAKIGSQLQAGVGRVAAVQIFQTEKLSDYKSLLQSSLHVGWRQHPPGAALTPGRTCSCASHAPAGTRLAAPAGEGRTKPNKTPLSSLTSESLKPHGKTKHQEISADNRTNRSDLHRHSLMKRPEAIPAGKTSPPAWLWVRAGGTYRDTVSNSSKCCCLSSAFALLPFKQQRQGRDPSALGVSPECRPPGVSRVAPGASAALKGP